MKVVVSITVELPAEVQRAGFTLYDSDGSVLASENSTGFNVTKKSPAVLLSALLAQAEHIAADCDAEAF